MGEGMEGALERIVAGILGALLLLPALVAGVVGLSLAGGAANEPNPFTADGMLCCAYPDTWTEVATLGGVAAAALAICALLALAGTGLLGWGMTGRRWRPRLVRKLVAVAGVGAFLGIVGIAVGKSRDRVTPPSCDTFAFDRRAWIANADRRFEIEGGAPVARGDRAMRDAEVQLLGLEHCPAVLGGKTEAQVRALLGTPDERVRFDSTDPWTWAYPPLRITFDRTGRVAEVENWPPERPDW